jgi:hypothetical protein
MSDYGYPEWANKMSELSGRAWLMERVRSGTPKK